MIQCIAFCERVSFSQFAAYIRVTEARWHARTAYKHYVRKAVAGRLAQKFHSDSSKAVGVS